MSSFDLYRRAREFGGGALVFKGEKKKRKKKKDRRPSEDDEVEEDDYDGSITQSRMIDRGDEYEECESGTRKRRRHDGGKNEVAEVGSPDENTSSKSFDKKSLYEKYKIQLDDNVIQGYEGYKEIQNRSESDFGSHFTPNRSSDEENKEDSDDRYTSIQRQKDREHQKQKVVSESISRGNVNGKSCCYTSDDETSNSTSSSSNTENSKKKNKNENSGDEHNHIKRYKSEKESDSKQQHQNQNTNTLPSGDIFSKSKKKQRAEIIEGIGRIVSSGTTIQGFETEFLKQVDRGDVLIYMNPTTLVEESAIVVNISTQRSLVVATRFSSDILSTSPFCIEKQSKILREKALQKKNESACDTDKNALTDSDEEHDPELSPKQKKHTKKKQTYT